PQLSVVQGIFLLASLIAVLQFLMVTVPPILSGTCATVMSPDINPPTMFTASLPPPVNVIAPLTRIGPYHCNPPWISKLPSTTSTPQPVIPPSRRTLLLKATMCASLHVGGVAVRFGEPQLTFFGLASVGVISALAA